MMRKIRDFFASPIQNPKQIFIVVFISILFIFLPQLPPSDWALNTVGLFENLLGVYQNPNFVYPPWALIPLSIYRLIRPEGTRVLSVIIIGLLCKQNQWSLFKFFTITLSPYFLVAMTKSNIDIISLVYPVLLLGVFNGSTSYRLAAHTIAVYLLLIKPQGAILLLPYLFFSNQFQRETMPTLLMILTILILPISLLGNPPLLFQWLQNIINPSPQNLFYWAINNISIIPHPYVIEGISLVIVCGLFLFWLVKNRIIHWSRNHSIASLLFLSMYFSPYASQQSFSSTLAFIPSIFSWVFQSIIVILLPRYFPFFDYLPFIILSIFLVSILSFRMEKSN